MFQSVLIAAMLLLALPSYAADLPSEAGPSTPVSAALLDSIATEAAAPGPFANAKPGPPTQIDKDRQPVTQGQFNELVRIFKRLSDRLDKAEGNVSKLSAKGAGGSSEAVDLGNLSSSTATSASPAAGGPHGNVGSSAVPNFKVYFDLDLIARPGIENLSFDNYHSFLFFEIQPTEDLQFSFDVNPSPKYYELDYQITRRLQLRAGKIWIPFDDMSPHNIFGGRVNVSRLTSETGAPAFLPDLWTDLGIGFKYNIIDRPSLGVELNGYIVNGFRDGGKDPKTPGSAYPSFSDLPSSADNNRDKALGGRLHALFFQKLGLGASYYSCRWTSDTGSAPNKRLSILGLDGSLRFKTTELRAGYTAMSVDLPTSDSANRGGLYAEIGQKFGKNNDWKVLLRGGLTQLDDRVTDTNSAVSLGDEQIVGATLLWKPGLIQYSIEFNTDMEHSPAKTNYAYGALRLVMAF